MMAIERIFLSPAHNFFGHHGQPAGKNPIVEVDAVEGIAGQGLRGDRFFGHKPDYKGQVTLFDADVFDALRAVFALPDTTPAALRRNLLVRGGDLNALVGKQFVLQGVRLEGVEECRPCHWMDQALAPGAETWLRGRGGLRCRILSSGWLRKNGGWDLDGAILAGGVSRRMGRDKTYLFINGEPLWRRQMRVLQETGAMSVRVVRGVGQPPIAEGVTHVYDTVASAGPLAGLHAALAATNQCHLAVLAVDMPAIDAGWFQYLVRFCRPGVGAMAQRSGRFEPLAAIYPKSVLPLAAAHLEQGRYSLQDLAKAAFKEGLLTSIPLALADQWRLANWNTPRDIRLDGLCA